MNSNLLNSNLRAPCDPQGQGKKANWLAETLVLLLIGLLLMAMIWAAILPSRNPIAGESSPANRPELRVARLDSTGWTSSWRSEGDGFELMTEPGSAGRWVCPHFPRQGQQPFCRRFPAGLLGACQKEGLLQIVLANGDVYRVDHALLGADGEFAPHHHPLKPMLLRAAWIPADTCETEAGSARVLAVDQEGQLLQFNGTGWQALDQEPMMSSA